MDEQRESGRRRVVLAVAGILAVLVALAAIFDIWPFDDGPLTKEEFIAKGDEICRDAHERYVDLQPSPPNTAEEATVLTGELLSISEDEYNDILDLEEPAELTAAVTRYLEARVVGIDLIRDAYEAAQDAKPSRYYRDLVKVADSQLRRLRLARAVGFSECSKPIAAPEAAE